MFYFFWRDDSYRQELEFTLIFYKNVTPLTWEQLIAYCCGAVGNADNYDFPWSRQRGELHYLWLTKGFKQQKDPWTNLPVWDFPLKDPPHNSLPSTLAQFPDVDVDDIPF